MRVIYTSKEEKKVAMRIIYRKIRQTFQFLAHFLFFFFLPVLIFPFRIPWQDAKIFQYEQF
jgi:hypothetical protein